MLSIAATEYFAIITDCYSGQLRQVH